MCPSASAGKLVVLFFLDLKSMDYVYLYYFVLIGCMSNSFALRYLCRL